MITAKTVQRTIYRSLSPPPPLVMPSARAFRLASSSTCSAWMPVEACSQLQTSNMALLQAVVLAARVIKGSSCDASVLSHAPSAQHPSKLPGLVCRLAIQPAQPPLTAGSTFCCLVRRSYVPRCISIEWPMYSASAWGEQGMAAVKGEVMGHRMAAWCSTCQQSKATWTLQRGAHKETQLAKCPCPPSHLQLSLAGAAAAQVCHHAVPHLWAECAGGRQ